VPFNVHKEFFNVKIADIYKAKLFGDKSDTAKVVPNIPKEVDGNVDEKI